MALRRAPVQLGPLLVRGRPLDVAQPSGEIQASAQRSMLASSLVSLPTLAEPDAFLAFAGGSVVIKPEAPSGIHIRGGASDQTGFYLDGIPVFNPIHAAGMFSAWNADALTDLTFSPTPHVAAGAQLSGGIAGRTVTPGPRVHLRGGASSTQARLTVDGPLGVGAAGFLLSMRSGYPSLWSVQREGSYLRGASRDWMGKIETSALGGQLRLLAYSSDNDLSAASVSATDGIAVPTRRHAFEWASTSLGAAWTRAFGQNELRLLAWQAATDASAAWAPQSGSMHVANRRRDDGLLAAIERKRPNGTTLAGFRVDVSDTRYHVTAADSMAPLAIASRTPLVSAFVQQAIYLGSRVEAHVGTSFAALRSRGFASPSARVRWALSPHFGISGEVQRSHQFAQSLRNAESVAGTIFPVDLYVGAGSAAMPVARSDQASASADLYPREGLRLSLQGYTRTFHGLALSAPGGGAPFATHRFLTGSGTARGVSLDGAVAHGPLHVLASYGLQQVQTRYGDASYVPDHGATHVLEGGAALRLRRGLAVRMNATGIGGRRGTLARGSLEWEACNVWDRGCEFGGSPDLTGETLGATRLPLYARVDVGFRQEWRFARKERTPVIGVSGTFSNVFRRGNVLTLVRDGAGGGGVVAVGMRDRAPLVFGLDWRF